MTSEDLLTLAAELDELPYDWHSQGTLLHGVLAAIVRHAPTEILHSLETGSGKSTVLFSQMSLDHRVFTLGETDSATKPMDHPRLRASSVTWTLGPSQQTLPRAELPDLDLVLVDGTHAFPWVELEYATVYPHLRTGSLLIVDDIHIQTIRNMFDFLSEDPMFELLEVVETTAFFRRTDAPTFTDGWWLQPYNKSRFPLPRPSQATAPSTDELPPS